MSAYEIFRYLHSGFRFLVLALILVAILTALAGWLGKGAYTKGNRKLYLFAMISAHTQFLIGLVLYFISPFVQFGSTTMKDATTRYWTVEHIAMMLFAIVLITIGHSRSKKATLPEAKHRAIAIFYFLAAVVVVVAIIQSQRPFLGITGL
jgi:cytochrome bd-type quinol oxidase subunit 2